MKIERLITLILAALLTIVVILWWFQAAALQQADFYEVGDPPRLVVCVTGTGPPAGGRFVGSGQTTIPPINC